MKQHAQERGKEFTLTIERFRELCEASGYHKRSGRGPRNLTIDRIENSIGYTNDNVRVISNAKNSAKGSRPAEGFFYQDEDGITHYIYSDAPQLEGDAPF